MNSKIQNARRDPIYDSARDLYLETIQCLAREMHAELMDRLHRACWRAW